MDASWPSDGSFLPVGRWIGRSGIDGARVGGGFAASRVCVWRFFFPLGDGSPLVATRREKETSKREIVRESDVRLIWYSKIKIGALLMSLDDGIGLVFCFC